MYGKQVQLLVQALPVVFRESCFALKGGTAINLFIRDLPRLSVDIDLVYLPSEDRTAALTHIKESLSRIHDNLLKTLQGLSIHKSFDDKEDALRLIVGKGDVRIKIELSPVLRGTVFEPEMREVSEQVEDQFGFVAVSLVSLAELESTREMLVEQLLRNLTADEKTFLISFKKGEPDWNLLGLKDIEQLPAVRWKQLNLDKMSVGNRKKAVEKLKGILNA